MPELSTWAMVHDVRALNLADSAPESRDNNIHFDDVASRLGYQGGLVLGTYVYAYMSHLPATHWGEAWLRDGAMTVQLRKPVYDGELLRVSGAADSERDPISIEVRGQDGVLRASAIAYPHSILPTESVPPRAPLPAERRAGSPVSLAAGTVMGTLTSAFDANSLPPYLDSIQETLPYYRDGKYAHPGMLLRWANWLLDANVKLGPWIHVSSDVSLYRTVEDGQAVEVRGKVVDEYERRGRRYVVIDVALLADGELAQRIVHTAIYEVPAPSQDAPFIPQ